ncbi:unnamed protein product [Moneuplotes crassus]|uniref:Transmembrane protein n=1 Tax=Euplotes crassus TaxID=5936 RepID=A0AAD1Y4J9_EUPCR|nr:unnamed protein product [Moneuplotes crassus]
MISRVCALNPVMCRRLARSFSSTTLKETLSDSSITRNSEEEENTKEAPVENQKSEAQYYIPLTKSPFQETSYLAEIITQFGDKKEYLKRINHQKNWRKTQKLRNIVFNIYWVPVLFFIHLYAIALYLRNPFDSSEED